MRGPGRKVTGMRSGRRRVGASALALAALVTALGATPTGAATLKADYQFQDTRASSAPGAPSLSDLIGVGNPSNSFVTDLVAGAPRRVLSFPKGNGVAMSSVRSLLPSASYSVVMLVRLVDVSGYRRYLDLTGGTSDNGFYNLSGFLVLFPVANGSSSPIAANAYEQVAVTRDANGTVVGYVDGVPVLGPYDDSSTGAAALASDTMRFFKDDDAVASEDSAGAVARIRVFEGALTPAEVAALSPPPPVLAKSVNVAPVRGEVFVSVPSGAAHASVSVPGLKGRRFVPLSQARQIPVGSLLDTRRGTVRLTSARDSKGTTQSSEFVSGVFQVLQSRRSRGLTDLRLTGSSFRACARRGRNSLAGVHASQRSRRTIRRLRGNGKGRFRTRGRYSAATVRGTDWTVIDRCDGTLTKVKRGSVTVRDLRRRKSVVVRAGKSYLARAKR